MAKKKTRKQKHDEYQEKFGNIPVDYKERLEYLYDTLGFDKRPKMVDDMITKRNNMLMNMQYYDLNIVSLYEIPEGTGRPRFRLINRQNFHNEAISASNFVHVYTVGAKDDFLYMRRMVEDELIPLEGLINTPVIIEYYAYFKTPSYFNAIDTVLAESGIIRPTVSNKPDWDNIGKKYCDMYNHNVWTDDATVIDGRVIKYFSVLPRIEIKLRYLNCIYTKQQYNKAISRKDYDNSDLFYLDNKGGLINGKFPNDGV